MADMSVQLVSWTKDPLETLYILWQASRTEDYRVTVDEIKDRMTAEPDFDREVRNLFLDFIESRMPLIENINFTFILHDIPVALREQVVRHRIGVHVGERTGLDIIPEQAQSTWWAQTMRHMDMGHFAEVGKYYTPTSIKDTDKTMPADSRWPGWHVRSAYREGMAFLQDLYNGLCQAGIPREDARNVLPLAATHGLSWTLNGGALRHIFANRTCWIAQVDIWGPVIDGMLRELVQKVHPIFRTFGCPPCVNRGRFEGCKFRVENGQRLIGVEDPFPPCSLWFREEHDIAMRLKAEYEAAGTGDRCATWQFDPERKQWDVWREKDFFQRDMLNQMNGQYERLWGPGLVRADRDD